MKDIPEGFIRIRRPTPNPFNEMVGPFFERRRGTEVSLGLRIEERHTNSRGICHGGLLATLADLALGYSALAIGGPDGNKQSFVTVSLSLDIAGSAMPGDWVASEVEVQKTGSRLAFANCYLVADGVRIVRASAIFALSASPK
ncbi:MAG: PaaI family thioesterase [Pseudomonadota bacterium]